jgi:hypothetical protein
VLQWVERVEVGWSGLKLNGGVGAESAVVDLFGMGCEEGHELKLLKREKRRIFNGRGGCREVCVGLHTLFLFSQTFEALILFTENP